MARVFPPPGQREGLAGDVHLGTARSAGEILDGVPVPVAGGEVHPSESAPLAQHPVHETHALEELVPVEVPHDPEARDHVADGDVGRPLPLMLGAHQILRRGPDGGQPLLQPAGRGGGVGVLIAQPLGKLHGEGRGQDLVAEVSEREGIRRAVALSEQDVGEPVRGEPIRAALDDLLREPAQVLHQGQAEGDGHRPQLADQERLLALEGQDEALERDGVEAAVGMGHQRPGEPDHARRALERPLAEPGKLAVEPGRQVGADVVQDVFDDVKVVDQPFRGGCGRALFFDDGGERPVAPEQDPAIVPDAAEQRGIGDLAVHHPVTGDGLGLQLQALDAEQVGPDRSRHEEAHSDQPVRGEGSIRKKLHVRESRPMPATRTRQDIVRIE